MTPKQWLKENADNGQLPAAHASNGMPFYAEEVESAMEKYAANQVNEFALWIKKGKWSLHREPLLQTQWWARDPDGVDEHFTTAQLYELFRNEGPPPVKKENTTNKQHP